MSFVPVFQYLAGLGVFGIAYWFLNGLLTEFINTGVSETGNTYNLFSYFWIGIIFIYLIFGGWWLVRKYNEQQYRGGIY